MAKKSPTKQKFIVDRTMRYRGKGDGGSRLRREVDGKMCCLGFYSLECGLSELNITNVPFPSRVGDSYWEYKHTPRKLPKSMSWLQQWEREIGAVNDNEDIHDSTRENKLTALFAQNGVEVEFIN